MKYNEVITPEAVERHLKMIEEPEAKEDEERQKEIRRVKEKELAMAKQLAPVVDLSKLVWPQVEPLFNQVTLPNFEIIASYIKDNFICAGSYPAAKLASVWCHHVKHEKAVNLTFNDIDIYHGKMGDGAIQGGKCT